jgi:hypothetical protein
MSGGISISFVDFTWFSFDFDRVRFGLFGLFLVRNWCGVSEARSLTVLYRDFSCTIDMGESLRPLAKMVTGSLCAEQPFARWPVMEA